MFKGSSCFPISPYTKDDTKKDNIFQDQMNIHSEDQFIQILSKVKIDQDLDTSFISDQ